MDNSLTSFVLFIIHKKRLVLLYILIVLTLLSILALSTITNVKSLTNIFDIFYPVKKEGITTFIVSSDAISPFTSIVDVEFLKKKLEGVEGIEVHPVFVTIGFVDRYPVVVYEIDGINNECAYLDKDLAEKVQKVWGNYIPIYSMFTRRTIFLKVCGLSDKPGVGVSHNVISSIRGTSTKYYSFAVIEVFNRSSIEKIYSILMPRVNNVEKLIERAIIIAVRMGKEVLVSGVDNPTQIFLSRIGIHREYIVYFAYSVALISLISLPLIGLGFIDILEKDIMLFMYLGISRKTIGIASTMIFAIVISIANTLATIIISRGALPGIKFLGYSIPIHIDLKDMPISISVQLLLCSIGVVWRLNNIET